MPQRVEGSIEVEAPVQEVYAYWQTLENLPQFMTNVEEVRSTGPDTTHWRGKGPLGGGLEFDARNTPGEPHGGLGGDPAGGGVQTPGHGGLQQGTGNRTRGAVRRGPCRG